MQLTYKKLLISLKTNKILKQKNHNCFVNFVLFYLIEYYKHFYTNS